MKLIAFQAANKILRPSPTVAKEAVEDDAVGLP
jgi:hypothetical protein